MLQESRDTTLKAHRSAVGFSLHELLMDLLSSSLLHPVNAGGFGYREFASMPAFCQTRCDVCGHERSFWSDATYLQLDSGALEILPHPLESVSCQDFGLTVQQATERKRLFTKEFFVCRNCGMETFKVKDTSWPADIEAPSPQAVLKFILGLFCMVMPFVIWRRRWDCAFALSGSALIVCFQTWREVRSEARKKPVFPTEDAPGKVDVPRPRSPDRCCDHPDLIEGYKLADEDHIPCRECGSGKLKVIGGGMS